jgi:hypothetical protein
MDTAVDKTMYLVQHVVHCGENESIKVIGIFTSKKLAIAAIKTIKLKPGFRKNNKLVKDPSNRNGFYIDVYRVNDLNWKDGFISVHCNPQKI